ncbi:uncharacterized protein LOC143233479 [Tachypleus tridentatus]|uniref:uncharacterized protein LOC143233479 n=1 Tax=Tachypleus tridentatus TaxID=6853 RepID=UPI003FCFE78A
MGRTGLIHTMKSFVKITLNAHVLCRIPLFWIPWISFKPGRLRLKKTSAVDRIVPTIFPLVELRTDLSLQGTGSTPLKPFLPITKRINLKLLEESAADDAD